MIIFFLLLTVILIGIAAVCSAIKDTVMHHFAISIFYNPTTNEKIFGFNKHWWYQSSWTNKWLMDEDGNLLHDKDGKLVPRTTKILFWDVQLLQIYDAWHFYKTIQIGANILADIMAGVLAVLIYIEYTPGLGTWFLLACGYFVLHSIVWNVVFNLFYDNLLIQKKYKEKKNI